MKAIVISTPGSPDVLQLEDRPEPSIKSDEVLINVKAAGVNRPDIIQRLGHYPAPPGAPADIPGLEVAGVITQAGANVSKFVVGDEVCALVAGGGYAELSAVPEGQCLPVPNGLTFIDAASLPETFFTVWTNVFDRAKFQKGDIVLVHGGTSGIGVTAIQMVKAMGGKVYVTAGNSEKCDFAQGIGATNAINYNEQDFAEIIKELEPEGIDIVLDMIGGDYTERNINLLKTEGRLVIINAMKNRIAEVDLMKIMVKRLVITGSTLRPRDTRFKEAIAQNLEKHIWPFFDSGKIRPVIHKTYPMEQAAEAHHLMESSKHIGKIVLEIE